MSKLTAPRVKKILAPYDQRLEITKEKLSHSQVEIKKALAGKKTLTRDELADQLEENGIQVSGQKLGHILAHSELDGLICSGPKRGKQFTYALFEERVPKYRELTREEALSKLALKYFESHGPAQTRDFAWWSGLSLKDANEAIDLNKSKLDKANLNGKEYWFLQENDDRGQDSQIACLNSNEQAFLLSIYYEYTIAYKDRSDISERRDIERMISMGNALTAVIIL